MKHRLFLLYALVLLAASLTACGGPAPAESVSFSSAAAETGPENNPIPADGRNHRQDWQEYGRLERLRLEIPADAPVAVQAANFAISRQEIEALAGEYTLFNGDEGDAAYRKAQEALIRKYAVYAHALAQGFETDEATLDALISDIRDPDSMNPADLTAFLEGFGDDEEGYWALYREDLRVLQSSALFRESCQAAYTDTAVPFETYYEDLVASLIAAENVQLPA